LESRIVLCLGESPETFQGIGSVLESEGYQLSFAPSNGPIRLLLVSLPFSLILVDSSGPPEETKNVCRRIRHITNLPILVLAELADTRELLSYLAAGANDYILKPVRLEELTARIYAVLQRKTGPLQPIRSQVLHCSDLVVDLASRRVLKAGREVDMYPIGFRLLVYFIQHEGEIISKEKLLQEVWGYEFATGEMNLVETAIQRLRKDLGDSSKNSQYIHTTWGSGYRFEPELSPLAGD
jgi:DNA-binding response OmpR family regulator